tara:strand:+ start:835 stop:1014 length:180 start_codon:yes stop_codon:yes gene_type:complete
LGKSKTNKMEKQKPGRKKIPDDQKVKMVSAYINDKEKKAILKKYGSLTAAIKEVVLPKL